MKIKMPLPQRGDHLAFGGHDVTVIHAVTKTNGDYLVCGTSPSGWHTVVMQPDGHVCYDAEWDQFVDSLVDYLGML